nr:uncharacterized protein LOC111505503 [Leptinotarsa decemlineata]
MFMGTHHKNSIEPSPVPRLHQHIHKLLIASDFTFDHHSSIQLVRTTMYEPVSDRCITTTIIKPSKLPSDEYPVSGYGDRRDLPPPEKPPRRNSRALRRTSQQESNEESHDLLLSMTRRKM